MRCCWCSWLSGFKFLGLAGQVGADDAMVDQRGKDVAEQDSEHHTLGVARVEEAHGDTERTDQESVDPLAGFGLGGGHGVGRHKDDTEGETAVEELHIARNRGDAGEVADAAHEEGAQNAGAHNLPAGDATPLALDGASAQYGTGFWDLFIGTVPGSVGETSVIAILLGAVLLIWTG
ncbi:MAG: RnfABCDGE type electron transport complex subunit D, partial [Bacteroidales bacterium]|nr:RnfABCDGE type electron transport complex subunit D [Bacteroidales bacterium]